MHKKMLPNKSKELKKWCYMIDQFWNKIVEILSNPSKYQKQMPVCFWSKFSLQTCFAESPSVGGYTLSSTKAQLWVFKIKAFRAQAKAAPLTSLG